MDFLNKAKGFGSKLLNLLSSNSPVDRKLQTLPQQFGALESLVSQNNAPTPQFNSIPYKIAQAFVPVQQNPFTQRVVQPVANSIYQNMGPQGLGNIVQRDPRKTLEGALRFGAGGLTAASLFNPIGLAKTASVAVPFGGAIGAGSAALQGQDIEEGAREGMWTAASRVPGIAGIARFSNPLQTSLTQRVGALAQNPWLARLAQAGVGGAASVPEGFLMNTANNVPYGGQDALFDAVIGGATFGLQKPLGQQEKKQLLQGLKLMNNEQGGAKIDPVYKNVSNMPSKLGDMRPDARGGNQLEIEEAIQVGDVKKALRLIDELPEGDPYKTQRVLYENMDQKVPFSEIRKGVINPVNALQDPQGPQIAQTQPGAFRNTKLFNELNNQRGGINPDAKVVDPFTNSADDFVENSFKGRSIQDLDEQATLSQLKATDDPKGFRDILANWVGQKDVAKTDAALSAMKFRDIPKEDSASFIKVLEGGKADLSPQSQDLIRNYRQEYDRLYQDATANGIDMKYVKDYVTHFWDQPEGKVAQLYQTFKRREGFQNQRSLPTYEEGLKMGLKPKYTSPAQILGEYASRVGQLKANLDLIKKGKEAGYIVDGSVARNFPGFEPITAPGFPHSKSFGVDGKEFTSNYYAPGEIAEQINKMFSPENTGKLGSTLKVTADISGKLQDIGLSGGIPYTPVNAFTVAQMQKEFLSGRVKSPIVSLVRSTFGDSQKFFADNASSIKEMQSQNIPIRSSFNVADIVGDSGPGTWWNKAINAPTFKRFMPQLQINLYKDIKNGAIKAGKSDSEAQQVAATAVKKFYGLTDTLTESSRSQIGKDALTTFAFAPKFRESMINFWKETIGAISPVKLTDGQLKLNNPLSAENVTNTKFAVGATLTLGAMNYLNEALNGHPMSANPEGKKDKLLIPVDDGKGTVIGIPYLSSIATVPRAVAREAGMLAEGNISGAAKDVVQSYGSMLIKPLADVAANEDYFGKEIVKESSSSDEKLKQAGSYLASQYTGHPYVKELTDQRNQDDPLYQRLSRATELPLRFYTQDSLTKGAFYDEYNKLKPIAEQFRELSYKDPKQAETFFNDNRDKLARFDQLKSQQDAYYAQKDLGQDNASILSGNSDIGSNTQAISPELARLKVKNSGQPVYTPDKVYFTGEDGSVDSINTNFEVKPPELTGDSVADKELMSTHKTDISTKINNARKLYENRLISVDEFKTILNKLSDKYTQASGNKAKKLSLSNINAFKIKRSGLAKSTPAFKGLKLGGSRTYKAPILRANLAGLKTPTTGKMKLTGLKSSVYL